MRRTLNVEVPVTVKSAFGHFPDLECKAPYRRLIAMGGYLNWISGLPGRLCRHRRGQPARPRTAAGGARDLRVGLNSIPPRYPGVRYPKLQYNRAHGESDPSADPRYWTDGVRDGAPCPRHAGAGLGRRLR